MTIAELRQEYHHRLCLEIIRIKRSKRKGDYPNFADGDSKSSKAIAWGIVRRLECPTNNEELQGQTAGKRFEIETKNFLKNAFALLHHLRPGKWCYSTGEKQTVISSFDQYEHLAYLASLINNDKELGSALGGDYIVKPDIVVGKYPISDNEINRSGKIIDSKESYAKLTPFRKANYATPLQTLHASISCKWTTRSDRAQNTRTEALNLIRNRKGHLPHVVVVTGEPLPMRIAALALGTGDIDCVYHFALLELRETLEELKNEDQLEMLNMMIEGKRLRDISDLPFDLAL